LLKGQTVGVIGAGRIGSAYARMMVSSSLSSASDQIVARVPEQMFQQNTTQINQIISVIKDQMYLGLNGRIRNDSSAIIAVLFWFPLGVHI